MRRFKYIWIVLLLILFGCNDFLNVRPDGEVVNDELLRDAEGFEDAIYGIYANIGSKEFFGQKLGYDLYDMLGQYYYNSYHASPTLHIIQFNYKHQDVRQTFDNIWIGLYKNIGYVNNVLINLENFSKADMSLYDVYKAECLALRAFLHFEVLRVYSENFVTNPAAAGIPYSKTYSYVVSPFLSSAESYTRIIEDLKDAETLLTANGEYFDAESGVGFLKDRIIHMNLYAVQAMLARVYWTKGDMKEAADYAKKVIDCGYFGLVDKSGVGALSNVGLSPNETIWGLFNPHMKKEVYDDMISQNSFALKSDWEDIYRVDNDTEGFQDYRREEWFHIFNDIGYGGPRPVKIYNWGYTSTDGRISGFNVIRLPEMYYIVAEYYLAQNDQANAMKYADQVRVSRGLAPFAGIADFSLSTANMIAERRKELICEGQYFHTLKRYNQDIKEYHTGKVFPASKAIYVFPLPDTETDYRE